MECFQQNIPGCLGFLMRNKPASIGLWGTAVQKNGTLTVCTEYKIEMLHEPNSYFFM